jgi:hypothetical protein
LSFTFRRLESGLDSGLNINDSARVVMKSAYELAMERLSKASPTMKLTSAQKAELAELDSQCAAKLAERELLLKGELEKAMAQGDAEAVEQLEKQLVSERKTIRANFEEKKEQIRQTGLKK